MGKDDLKKFFMLDLFKWIPWIIILIIWFVSFDYAGFNDWWVISLFYLIFPTAIFIIDKVMKSPQWLWIPSVVVNIVTMVLILVWTIWYIDDFATMADLFDWFNAGQQISMILMLIMVIVFIIFDIFVTFKTVMALKG